MVKRYVWILSSTFWRTCWRECLHLLFVFDHFPASMIWTINLLISTRSSALVDMISVHRSCLYRHIDDGSEIKRHTRERQCTVFQEKKFEARFRNDTYLQRVSLPSFMQCIQSPWQVQDVSQHRLGRRSARWKSKLNTVLLSCSNTSILIGWVIQIRKSPAPNPRSPVELRSHFQHLTPLHTSVHYTSTNIRA